LDSKKSETLSTTLQEVKVNSTKINNKNLIKKGSLHFINKCKNPFDII